MQRISDKTLIERFSGKIPDGTHFKAKNLDDFLTTIENHTLTKHKEIILVEFEFPIKAKIVGMDGIGYFYNDQNHNKTDFYQLHNSFVEQGAQLLRVQDSSIEFNIPLYGHQDLFLESLEKTNGNEFIIQKPNLYFLSIFEIGQGLISDYQTNNQNN